MQKLILTTTKYFLRLFMTFIERNSCNIKYTDIVNCGSGLDTELKGLTFESPADWSYYQYTLTRSLPRHLLLLWCISVSKQTFIDIEIHLHFTIRFNYKHWNIKKITITITTIIDIHQIHYSTNLPFIKLWKLVLTSL